MRYKVTIVERLYRQGIVEVEASSAEEASRIVDDRLEKGDESGIVWSQETGRDEVSLVDEPSAELIA